MPLRTATLTVVPHITSAATLSARPAQSAEVRPLPVVHLPWSELVDRDQHGAADRQVLRQVFFALTDQERVVVRLRFWDRLSRAEIGTRIGVSRTQVSRILRRIAEKTGQLAGGQAPALAG